MVSPMPSARSVPIPAVDFTSPAGGGPASVTPRCSGWSTVSESMRYASIISATLLAFTEIFTSSNPTSAKYASSRCADATSASGVMPPCASAMSGSRLPALTPMRIGRPRSFASCATVLICAGLRMLPGLRRRPCTPASIAASARRYWKWMSAMIGTGERGTICASPSAAASSLHVQRTMSHPAAARA